MWRERWSPPRGLGATWPTRCFCCDQRLALAQLTPKRSAACRQLAPANTADATRWRRSTDKVVGMASSLPRQRSLAQHSFRSNELRSSQIAWQAAGLAQDALKQGRERIPGAEEVYRRGNEAVRGYASSTPIGTIL